MTKFSKEVKSVNSLPPFVIITYNKEYDSATIKDKNGKLLPATTLFWFAWNAFHPDTLIYK